MHGDAPRPIDETAALAALDRTLDALFDDRSERADASSGRPSALGGTAVALRALDDARPPDPSFVAHLEAKLMSAHALDPTVVAPALSPPTRTVRPAARPRRVSSLPAGMSSRWRGVIEVFSFAALLALLLGQTIGFGGNLAFWRPDPTATPAGRPLAAPGAATPDDASPAADDAAEVAVERGNAGRTGVYATTGPAEQPELLWRYTVPNGDPTEVLEPIAAGGTAYFSILLGTGYVVSPFTLPAGEGGFSFWLRTSGDSVNLAVDDGTIYAASTLSADREQGAMTETPALVAYDAGTTEERWRVDLDFAARSSPVVAGDTLVVLGEGALAAFDATTGEERWRAPVAQHGDGEMATERSPAIAGDTVVVNVVSVGDGISGTLRAFDLTTGEARWSVPSAGGYFSSPAIADGMVYAYQVNPSRLVALDLATGETVWSFRGPDEGTAGSSTGIDSPVVEAGAVYTFERQRTGASTMLTAHDGQTGEVRWQHDLGGVFARYLSVADGVLYFTMDDGTVHAASAADGTELWHVDTGDATLGTPVPYDGYLVLASRSAVYAFGPARGPDAAPVDVSGLPACIPPRTVPETPPSGEPARSLVPVEDNPLGFGVPSGGRMLLADVPSGEPADAATVAGIFATLRSMTACQRPGSELALAGFYSDDYFRRFDQIERPPGKGAWGYSVVFSVGGIEVADLGAPVVLEDGRVAVLAFDPLGDRGTLLVFVEQDGAWLIDEVVEVGRDPEVWRQG